MRKHGNKNELKTKLEKGNLEKDDVVFVEDVYG